MATYTTKQQKAVLDCLSERADSPVSAAAIVDALREQGEHIGIATVYRQLEKLERQGRVPQGPAPQGHDGRGRVLSVLHPRLRIGLLPL